MENNIVVKLNNIDVYQKEALILKEVNLEINSGEFIYLIGKTGSGKSSLLKILYADIPINKDGDAEVCGFGLKKIKSKKISRLRRSLGIVFQDFQLLDDRSVRNNLIFALKSVGWKNKEAINAKILDVLTRVEMQDFIDKMPHQLAGGEQQRVAIARALLNDPVLILADEPTGNLDPKTSEDILELLNDINKTGTAVIMATHDYMLTEKYPKKTLVCEDAKLNLSK